MNQPSGAPALSHLDAEGTARMVDVGAKQESQREAVAAGEVRMAPETLRLLRETVAPELAEVYPQFAAKVFGPR